MEYEDLNSSEKIEFLENECEYLCNELLGANLKINKLEKEIEKLEGEEVLDDEWKFHYEENKNLYMPAGWDE